MRLVFAQVMVNAFYIPGGWYRPADLHLGQKHPRNAGVHFFFLDEITTGGTGQGAEKIVNWGALLSCTPEGLLPTGINPAMTGKVPPSGSWANAGVFIFPQRGNLVLDEKFHSGWETR